MHQSQGSEPAGLDIDGKSVEVDVGSDYDSYKTFEIEFENSPSMLAPFFFRCYCLPLLSSPSPLNSVVCV